MGIGDKLASMVDGYYKITDPAKYSQRMGARELASAFRYRSAKNTRLSSNIRYGNASADHHIQEFDLDVMRDKSRALDRDNIFFKSIMDRLGEAVIGDGVKLNFDSGNKRWNARAKRLCYDWWNGSPEARGMFSGPEIEKLVFRAFDVDGDVLCVKLPNSRKIQVIEGDRIRTPNDKRKDNVINGVKLDAMGMPIEYYVFPHADVSVETYATISAEDAIFFANRHRISQTRGIPTSAQSIELYEDIDAFTEASIIQQKMSANHVMFVERNGGVDMLDNVTTTEDSQGNQRQEQISNPGTILYGEIGESAKMLGASQTGQQFSPFVTQLLRFSGLPYGMPLEILALDFSKTNYSSARGSLLTAHKSFLLRHKKFVREFLEPVFRWYVSLLVRSGQLDDRDYVLTSTPPKVISLDPAKEVKANVEKIQAGLTTNKDVLVAEGVSWRDVMNDREEEILHAYKIATNVVMKTGEQWSTRDILGMNKNFNPSVFQTEQVEDDDDNTDTE